jgi:hypothetical protein
MLAPSQVQHNIELPEFAKLLVEAGIGAEDADENGFSPSQSTQL